jgi:hypothetical protein
MLAQIQGGKVVSVAPKDVSRAKIIYPLGS